MLLAGVQTFGLGVQGVESIIAVSRFEEASAKAQAKSEKGKFATLVLLENILTRSDHTLANPYRIMWALRYSQTSDIQNHNFLYFTKKLFYSLSLPPFYTFPSLLQHAPLPSFVDSQSNSTPSKL